jgi:hypothetical protein
MLQSIGLVSSRRHAATSLIFSCKPVAMHLTASRQWSGGGR